VFFTVLYICSTSNMAKESSEPGIAFLSIRSENLLAQIRNETLAKTLQDLCLQEHHGRQDLT
jgi:hypothetical protein